MSAFLALNNDFTVAQPSALKEELVRQVHNRVSITGVQRRIWLADKHQATLTWSAVNQTQYAQLAAYIYNQGNTITYTNTVTGFNFIGFATASEDNFMQGTSFLKNISVTILEV